SAPQAIFYPGEHLLLDCKPNGFSSLQIPQISLSKTALCDRLSFPKNGNASPKRSLAHRWRRKKPHRPSSRYIFHKRGKPVGNVCRLRDKRSRTFWVTLGNRSRIGWLSGSAKGHTRIGFLRLPSARCV